ncbi:hypothetical protein I4U23_011230 [Adineta vaga]|nr:hypothetical protein I4U23_011230 [Adineta vaga]
MTFYVYENGMNGFINEKICFNGLTPNGTYINVGYFRFYSSNQMIFHLKYILYLTFLHCVSSVSQRNLYFSDEINIDSFDERGLRYNCLRFNANVKRRSVSRDILSWCMSESSLKFSDRNISSAELYQWSVAIDIIQEYQYYLESNDVSLKEKLVYKCTLPRFGSMCQYSLYYYNRRYKTIYESISSPIEMLSRK